jgi:hypothetical protein
MPASVKVGSMDANEQILARSRPGILTIVLALWSLGAAFVLSWTLAIGGVDGKFLSSAPLLALVFGLMAVVLL